MLPCQTNFVSFSLQHLQDLYPTLVPAGTILVLRTHPDLTSEYTSAISVRLDDDIVWNTFPYLCRVSHRGIRPDYHTNSTFMNRSRISMPLSVPIPLLLLETDWPLPSLHQHATLYGCPRLQRGPQVSLASTSFSSIHHLRFCLQLRAILLRHTYYIITRTAAHTNTFFELATFGIVILLYTHLLTSGSMASGFLF